MARPLNLVRTTGAANPDADFDWFWSEFPRKKSKGDAYRAWHQTAAHRPDIEKIISVIDKNLADGTWRDNEPQFIPYPASWLRAWGWADE